MDKTQSESVVIRKMDLSSQIFTKKNENVWKRFTTWFKGIPNRKHHIDFLIALLTVPILLTAMITNLANLRNTNQKSATPPPISQPAQIILKDDDDDTQPSISTVSTSPEVCKKEIGPISISSPQENQEVTTNPVSFIIRYEDSSYCSVVWSYRINDGNWSEYSSNAPSIYNLENGSIRFQLRVQSTVSNDQEILERTFIYKGRASTPTPTASSSAAIQ